MKKLFFLIFHGFNEANGINGISKKIRYQVKAPQRLVEWMFACVIMM